MSSRHSGAEEFVKRSRLRCTAVVCAAAGELLIGGPGLSTAFADPGDGQVATARADTSNADGDARTASNRAPTLTHPGAMEAAGPRRPPDPETPDPRRPRIRRRPRTHEHPGHEPPDDQDPGPTNPPEPPRPRTQNPPPNCEPRKDPCDPEEPGEPGEDPEPEAPPDGDGYVPPVKRPAFELPQPPQPKVTAEPDVVDMGSRLAVPVVGTVGGPPVLPFPVVVIPPVNVVPPIVGAPPARPAGGAPGTPPGVGAARAGAVGNGCVRRRACGCLGLLPGRLQPIPPHGRSQRGGGYCGARTRRDIAVDHGRGFHWISTGQGRARSANGGNRPVPSVAAAGWSLERPVD